MSYITKDTLEKMFKREFKYRNIVIEEIQIDGKFHNVKDKSLRIHYQEE